MNIRLPLIDRINAALDREGAGAAIDLCVQQIEQVPDDAEAFRHLGLLEARAGKPGLAMKWGKRACELAPDDPRCWSDLGRICAMLNRMDDAVRCFTEAVDIDARYADGWHNLGAALKQTGQLRLALTAFRNALLIEPDRADTYLNLAASLDDAGRPADAVEALDRAMMHDPDMPQARSRMGFHLAERGKVDAAERLFRQSLAMDPDHIDGWLGLARALEDRGEAIPASEAWQNLLQRRPDHAQALGAWLAMLRDENTDATEARVAMAESAAQDDRVQDEARALIGYGLAKYHDRHRRFDRAAHFGTLANAARRRTAGALDREALSVRVDAIIATYDAAFFAQRRRFGLGTDQPVFIVGLPRSGTTLTEQILSAHPALHGAGELPDLGRIAERIAPKPEQHWQAARLIDEASSRRFAGQYLKALRDGAPRRRRRISDKSPLNFFQLGLAALLFPNALVIHCSRAARDNALSIWMENFNPDQHYATDFGDLAFFTAQYERLMEHWRQALPLRMLETPYEQTVADLEGSARALIDFLDVNWDERCLSFHNSSRAVQTPSRWQVRTPLYSSSVDRWCAYAPYLPQIDTAFRTRSAPE